MFKTITTVCLFAISAMLVGCGSDVGQSNLGPSNGSQEEAASNSHPKLSLHKPKTFSSAVQRLRQIHESLIGDGDFPSPLAIEYVEVIHGQGASGHSHYYSAADYAANEIDDHGDHDHGEDEAVEHHTMEVDIRTELTDIATWLPGIAAKSDLDESGWNAVNSISSQLSDILGTIASDVSDASFRDSWKLKSSEVEPMLDKLQSLVGTPGEGE